MKLPFSAALLASALLAPSFAQADDAALVDTLKAFTRCDETFFSRLNTHRDAWQAYAPLKQQKDFTWIAVRDRTEPKASAVPVSAPAIAGLKLLSITMRSAILVRWACITSGALRWTARLMRSPRASRRCSTNPLRCKKARGNTRAAS